MDSYYYESLHNEANDARPPKNGRKVTRHINNIGLPYNFRHEKHVGIRGNFDNSGDLMGPGKSDTATVVMRPSHPDSPSGLLTLNEQSILNTLLGPRCNSLATTVVQLFLTDQPEHAQWRRKDAGVMCFVKDHVRRSYFFRLYCLGRRSLVWEQQVYNDLDYQTPRPWLHTFEAESSMAAFNFASEPEAENFKFAVRRQLEAKRQRREERRSRLSIEIPPGSMPNLSKAAVNNKHHRSVSSGARVIDVPSKTQKKDKNARFKIKKEDIGMPQDFRHVSHVGWDPNKGFDVDLDQIQDPNLKKFLEIAGVSDVQLQDKSTREFIYDFLERNGGLAAVTEEVAVQPTGPAPPVPTRTAPPPHKPSPPPPPPSRLCPPTPGQQRSVPPPPPPPAPSAKPQNQNAPAPPPPPPPPPMGVTAPLAPPPPMAAPAAVGDSRSQLMDAIKSGRTLKHVEVEKRAIPDSRGELLDQIRQGVELKAVQPNERPTGGIGSGGLAGALAEALAKRFKDLNNDSDESDSGNDGSDSDWED